MDDSESAEAYTRRRALALGAGLAAGATTVAGTASAQSDAYGGHLAEAEWDGTTVDASGADEVTVAVGAGPQGLQFDPPAIYVEPGTTIVWEWTGNGGGHNVYNIDQELFDSREVTDETAPSTEGATFEFGFEEGDAAFYPYVCLPHQALQMKGVVAVGEENVETELVALGGGDSGGGLDRTAVAAGASAFSVVALLGIAAYRELVGEATATD